MRNGRGSLWTGSRLPVTRAGEGLTCDCLALEVGGYVEWARESLDRVASVCNPRGRGAYLDCLALEVGGLCGTGEGVSGQGRACL